MNIRYFACYLQYLCIEFPSNELGALVWR